MSQDKRDEEKWSGNHSNEPPTETVEQSTSGHSDLPVGGKDKPTDDDEQERLRQAKRREQNEAERQRSS